MSYPRKQGNAKDHLGKPVDTLQDKWKLLRHFQELRGLVKQHIDSYDDFVNNMIYKIVVENKANNEVKSDVDDNFRLAYTNIMVGTPTVDEDAYIHSSVDPNQCRLRDRTYSAPISVDVRYTRGRQTVVKQGVVIGKLPVMLRSSRCVLTGKSESELWRYKECPYDPGGYFIVKGQEKVILIQEQLSKNRVILELDAKGNLCATITSIAYTTKSRTTILIKNGKVYLKNNSLGEDMPIVPILRAMGVQSDQEIVAMVGAEPEIVGAMAASLEESSALGIFTQEQALHFIGTKIGGKPRRAFSQNRYAYSYRQRPPVDEARDTLAQVVLPHVSVRAFDFRPKAIYIAHIVRRVLLAARDPERFLDDKDYYGNKRLELAGGLLQLLFEDLFKKFNNDLKSQANKALEKPNAAAPFDIIKNIRPDTITNGMVLALATGNWSLKRFKMERAGITQVLSRLSYISALGMMTRVNSQFEKTRKVSGPRSLQPSQWGMLCPCDTPEGEACGLVKNLALLAHITTEEQAGPIHRICYDLGVEPISLFSGEEINHAELYLVMVNGLLVGMHARPEQLVQRLRALRRNGIISECVSVMSHELQRCVHIASDGGRVCRPLLIVDQATRRPRMTQAQLDAIAAGEPGHTIARLIKQGCIEYVDVNEENNCLIALSESDLTHEHTHLEIDPLTILGLVAGLIPFPHHNQSPRNTYQCAMGKQSIGTIAMNQYQRVDTLLYTMVYPMKPLVTTRVLDLIKFNDVPGGQNAVVAVMSQTGYDIEDAIVLNKASLDRGYGRCFTLRKHSTAVKRYPNNTIDRIVSPPMDDAGFRSTLPMHQQKYGALDVDGLCEVGQKVEHNQVLVNKEQPTNTSDSSNSDLPEAGYKPCPMSYKARGSASQGPDDVDTKVTAYVDKVLLTSSDVDQRVIKVLIRQCRRPEVGDKFSSRHGQKGVCGIIIGQEDMPFTDAGIVPDLIMNPHGFPSRMTVAKMIELVAGKAAVFRGKQAYGTAFGEEYGSADRVEDCAAALVQNGYNYTGKDLLYSGLTGEPIMAYIFMGPVFYQKLKHMVVDKVHARSRGRRTVLTRQPTEGRSRDGGLRLGEMERDCLIGYGASMLLMERLMISSDGFSASVCRKCGYLGYAGNGGWQWCSNCSSAQDMAYLEIPYACKLLFQELQAMNIMPRLKLQDM